MANNNLQPNFFEISIEGEDVALHYEDYSDALFSECKQNNNDYFYYRNGSELCALPLKDDLESIKGFNKKVYSIDENPYLISRLISLAFKRYFESIGREVFKKRYSSEFFFDIPENTEESTKVGLLELQPICLYSVFPLIKEDKTVYVMAISKEDKPRFSQDQNDYLKSGIDIRDWDIFEDRIPASVSNIKKYLERSSLQAKYDSSEDRLRNKSNEFNFINKTIQYFVNNYQEISTSEIKFSNFNYLSLPNANFDIIKINKPTNFYYNKNTASGYLHTALQQVKPYSYDVFNGKKVSVCAFVPKPEVKQCERFLNSFKECMQEVFHINDIEFVQIDVGMDRREHLQHIAKFSNKQYDLAIVFLYRKDKSQDMTTSAYNRLKAKLISKQIPSQSILIENIRTNNEYTLRNVALNSYSKIGGTPWTVEKDPYEVNEFIIGVGSTLDEDGNRNIGFTNVFDRFGSYIVGDCSQLSNINQYRENLKSHISSILSEVIDSYSIGKSSKIRLIFHLFKKASRRYEIDAINKCLEEYSDYEIEFAIINVSYDHPFKLFKNVTDQLDRGAFIKLTSFQALLCMGGKGSKPLQITLDKRSTYTDLFELSKQILYFSHLSHSSFKPPNNPVTISYPDKLAKLTTDLLKINHWDPDMLNGMKDKLWFI